MLERLDDTVRSEDHFEFSYFPHTDLVQTKTNTRLEAAAPRRPLPKWRHPGRQSSGEHRVRGLNWVTAVAPQAIPRIHRVTAGVLSERTDSDHSYAVLATERTVRFRESEFSLPRDQMADVLRDYFRRGEQQLMFSIEVRFTAADDRWLSTYGGPSACVAVRQYHRVPVQPYFRDVWAMLDGP